MKKVFIDGSAGTTGLRIYERLSCRRDIFLITLSDEKRKDEKARAEALNAADIAFLCLPDDAAREAVALTVSENTAIIDTSTAHRTAEGWIYGFPELTGQREKIKNSKRIANPGCHASGFIALVAPLTEKGVIAKDEALSCLSLTGYSGGGKKMIAEYEAPSGADGLLAAPRLYGLTQKHKHLPEMQKICGLKIPPAFCPVVAPYYSGMEVIVPVFGKKVAEIEEIYKEYYTEGLIRFVPNADENGFMSACALSGKDTMEITVLGNDERALLVSRFDNLGKGASGAAIQNMNLLLGADEKEGLCV
ncbi:MAG: N-acetyl-gamma-glutamyl-phosphate reductase [Clostridia bacterium]|nr:N-acetyl-gamma-glutamyl-phosphate reductase [Clostridia bacterium]